MQRGDSHLRLAIHPTNYFGGRQDFTDDVKSRLRSSPRIVTRQSKRGFKRPSKTDSAFAQLYRLYVGSSATSVHTPRGIL
jgi:hypothetical protein